MSRDGVGELDLFPGTAWGAMVPIGNDGWRWSGGTGGNAVSDDASPAPVIDRLHGVD